MDWEPYNRHAIRLRGPWDVEWLTARKTTDGLRRRVKLPAEWRELFGDRQGVARFHRRFQCPSGLDSYERVFIVVEQVGGAVSLRINDTSICVSDVDEVLRQQRFEVTEHLRPTNVLTLEISYDPATAPQGPGGLWQPVLIEIRDDDRPGPDE